MILGINTGKIWLAAMLCLCFFVIPLGLYGICEVIRRIDRKRLGRDNPYCKKCTAVKELSEEKDYWYNEYIKAEQIIAMLTVGRNTNNEL